ncbi:sucrase ferredoxin [Kribbella caucasensis]|nr:sucrase ferredoxin [Kribbella sp. VKM Ac-2527]
MTARTAALDSAGLCSAICRELDEPMPGTAVVAAGWVVVEQPGPWGRKAPTQSHLDPDFGAKIDADCKKVDLRFGLIRSPGKHADAVPRAHQVYVASTAPGRTWLLGGCVDEPAALASLDLDAVSRGDLDAVRASLPELSPVTQPVLLICTNGKRDECCALFGRPLVTAMAAVAPGRVWESSHLSGHRFSPTAALLPAGTLHGRLTVESATAVLAAADRGETVIDTLRGRSTWTKRGQVADIAVRDLSGEVALEALSVIAEDLETVTVRHTDGRTWIVDVAAEPADPPRPESCGKEPYDMSILRAGTVRSGAHR